MNRITIAQAVQFTGVNAATLRHHMYVKGDLPYCVQARKVLLDPRDVAKFARRYRPPRNTLNVQQAAKQFGVDRSTVARRLAKMPPVCTIWRARYYDADTVKAIFGKSPSTSTAAGELCA